MPSARDAVASTNQPVSTDETVPDAINAEQPTNATSPVSQDESSAAATAATL